MPYPNEHAARLTDPKQYDSFRRQNNKFGPGIHAIFGIKTVDGKKKSELQAIRFDKAKFTVAEAKRWLKDHKYTPIEFEPAGERSASDIPDDIPGVDTKLADIRDRLDAGVLETLQESIGDLDAFELCYKTTAKLDETDEHERSAVQWISTSDIDRDNEILVPEGVVLDHFKMNPVVLWAHSYHLPPIGSDQWVKVVKGRGIKVKSIYSSTPFAQDIFTLKQEGHLRAQSVGFIPVAYVNAGADGWTETVNDLLEKWGDDFRSKWRKIKDTVRRIITKWVLLEHSDVPVPSNPTALVEAVSKGVLQLSDETRNVLAHMGQSAFIHHGGSTGGDDDPVTVYPDIEPKLDITGMTDPPPTEPHVVLVDRIRHVERDDEKSSYQQRERTRQRLERLHVRQTGRL